MGHVVDHATAQRAGGFVAHRGLLSKAGWTRDLRTSHAGPITSSARLATPTAERFSPLHIPAVSWRAALGRQGAVSWSGRISLKLTLCLPDRRSDQTVKC